MKQAKHGKPTKNRLVMVPINTFVYKKRNKVKFAGEKLAQSVIIVKCTDHES
jgi:hypothetical protein